jgi:hypothetical protein
MGHFVAGERSLQRFKVVAIFDWEDSELAFIAVLIVIELEGETPTNPTPKSPWKCAWPTSFVQSPR